MTLSMHSHNVRRMPNDAYHVGAPVAVAAGASVSAMLFTGSWPDRLIAGAVGGLFSWVATPIFTPLAHVTIVWIYQQAGADPTAIPADAVPGLTGFTLGIVGLDACIWLTKRVRQALSVLSLPWSKPPAE
jgi:hypothetical protein